MRKVLLAELNPTTVRDIIRQTVAEALAGERWACELILAYALGRPKQAFELDIDDTVKLIRLPLPGPVDKPEVT